MVEKLKADMIEAMKNKDKKRLTVIRMVKAAMDQEHIDKKREINDELLIDVVNKQIKMRKDSIVEFQKGMRNDLVEETQKEIDILMKYLPEQLSLEEVEKAAEFADVRSNIEEFKDKYETLIGEKGVSLSGGQKQRISIARAIVKDPKILVLDDSVSAVDVKTEETILHNIQKDRKGKTTILIASRVSTVKALDKIIVMNDGKVEAFGTHEECLKNSKTYTRMVELQSLEKEMEGE